jgi:hypothetical protein
LAWTCADAETPKAEPRKRAGRASKEDPERITPVSKLTGDPERITPVSKLTGDPERRRPKRLERVRTGWDVHFRELALTRIPVKITTPSLLLVLISCTLSAGDLIIGDRRAES